MMITIDWLTLINKMEFAIKLMYFLMVLCYLNYYIQSNSRKTAIYLCQDHLGIKSVRILISFMQML